MVKKNKDDWGFWDEYYSKSNADREARNLKRQGWRISVRKSGDHYLLYVKSRENPVSVEFPQQDVYKAGRQMSKMWAEERATMREAAERRRIEKGIQTSVPTDWLGSRTSNEERKLKYAYIKGMTNDSRIATRSRSRTWPNIFRRIGYSKKLLNQLDMPLVSNPDNRIPKGDVDFIRNILIPWTNISKVKIAWEETSQKWPDIWVITNHVPTIVLTPEWRKQSTDERRKRLVHEFIHLRGESHPGGGSKKIGKYTYSTFPHQDSYSKAMYRKLIGRT